MHKQTMAEILFDLRKELTENEQLEAHQRQSMQALADEIDRKINDPEALMSGDQFLLTRLKESAEEFEAKHPALTNIIGRLSNLLSDMGI